MDRSYKTLILILYNFFFFCEFRVYERINENEIRNRILLFIFGCKKSRSCYRYWWDGFKNNSQYIIDRKRKMDL